MKITLILLLAGCLSSCSIPTSPAVAAHAAGEMASPVAFGATKTATGRSPEADKAHDFWGGAR